MKIALTARFQREFLSIVDYIIDNFDTRAANEFSLQVETKISWLSENPEIGRIEPLLADRTTEYHCLIVSKHNKIIYRYNSKTVYVVDIWDMRRDPSYLASRIKTKLK